MKLSDLPEKLRKRNADVLAREFARSRRTAMCLADLEQGTGHVSASPDAAQETDASDSPVRCVRLVYVCERKRLADADGIWTKWATDGLVLARVLSDDSPVFVKEVSLRQVKSKRNHTRIEIWSTEEDNG